MRILNGIGTSAFCVLLFGCALAVTRPVQEMSNADAALRAARDVNADTLSPEMYRKAAEYFFRAKREYKLKNFDVAKSYALRATRLAERAEFQAYRSGGATPEVLGNSLPTEGGSVDIDSNFRSLKEQESQQRSEPQLPAEASPRAADAQPDEKQEGVDYNEYLRLQELEKKEQEKSEKDKKEKDSKTEVSPQGKIRKVGRGTAILLAQGTFSISPSQAGAIPNPQVSAYPLNRDAPGTPVGEPPAMLPNERALLQDPGPPLYPGPDLPNIRSDIVPTLSDRPESENQLKTLGEGNKPIQDELAPLNSRNVPNVEEDQR